MSEIQTLRVPQRKSVRYERNFINAALVELRFPVLLELEYQDPVQFQKLLRKEYPHYSKQKGVALNETGAAPIPNRYVFESKRRDCVISLRPDAITIELRKYKDYEDFRDRLSGLLDHSEGLLETSFFTRVGLRYINRVPLEDGVPEGWINEALIAPLSAGVLGTISKYHNEVRGYVEGGLYTFQHGVANEQNGDKALLSYYLDFDYAAESVEYQDVLGVVDGFNSHNFSFFYWALGKKARDYLGEGREKAGNE